MSPEQASGREDIDERADIWATALLLYECLTGELPFQGSNYLGVIAQILSKETQPPSTLRPELGIPLGADRIVLRGLEKDREKRYQRMADFERAMDRLLAGEMDVGLDDGPSENAPSPRPTRRRWPWPVPLAAILALGAGSAALLARTEKEKPRESPPALRVVSAPAMSNPLPLASAAPAAKTETTAPNEPMRPTANDRIRHPSKSHAPRPPTPLEDTSPKVPKSKADDRVAPSPYGDREGR
jgi:serine/threonine protein kinase